MKEFSENKTESKEQRLKRMLGFRDFPQRTSEEKKRLLGSDERVRALDSITTTTLPVAKKEMKKGVALEVVEKKFLSSELLKKYPLVYIGSGTDIEYALALGGRIIKMIDPIFKDELIQKEVFERVERLIGEKPKILAGQKLNFNFDFGAGKETVSVELVAKSYSPKEVEGYDIPTDTGLIVFYASQGPGGAVFIDESMKSKLAEGGAIIEETRIIKKEGGQVIELGK